jgi:rod shape-determining protein MreC
VRVLSPGARRLLVLAASAAALGVWQAAAPDTFLPGTAAAWAAYPAQTALATVGRSVSAQWWSMIRARDDAARVRELRRRLGALRQENLALAEQTLENHRLRQLLGLRASISRRTVAGEVIGRQVEPNGRLLIGRGRRDGIRVGAPVIAPDGLLGQVERALATSAWVLPLASPGARVPALVERTRQAGTVAGEGGGCRIEDLELGADLLPGDLVIASGVGGVYPKGVAIGRIGSVRREPSLSRASAEVQPAANWREVEEVLVVID